MFNEELQIFIDQSNARRKLFDMKELRLPNDLSVIRMMLEAEGSPENLSMDGKISVNAYEKRKNFWSKAMSQLNAYEQERG